MTISASLLFRATSIALAAGLGLTACSSDAYENQPGGNADDTLSQPETPSATAGETALAETFEEDFEVSTAMTLEDQWPDITAMESALASTSEPDLYHQAGASQYGLLVDAQPSNVRASIDD